MQIHQLVHTLNYGDAISGEAIAIQRLLRERSIESNIYCLHSHEKVRQYATDWREFDASSVGAVGAADEGVGIIHHYSLASPLNQLFRDASGAARYLIYHNLTPAHWYYRYNARVVADLEQGRDELIELSELSDVVLADSEYNRLELVEFGCAKAQVLPLLLDLEKWSVPANPGIASVLKTGQKTNLLHVGRLAPNKRLEDIIKAFYFYHHKMNRDSKLWLIGSDVDNEIYSFELRELVTELRLKEAVEFVGTVADGELRSFYENSDVYLCMSEHEGFCVPMLEAMHFNLPIIAYDACAVGETLGGGGLLLSRKTPVEVAELIDTVVSDGAIRERLVSAGRKRVAMFDPSSFSAKLEQMVVAPLASRAGGEPRSASCSR